MSPAVLESLLSTLFNYNEFRFNFRFGWGRGINTPGMVKGANWPKSDVCFSKVEFTYLRCEAF